MRAKFPARTRSVVALSAAVLLSAAALVVVLTPESSASPSALPLPLPLPVSGVESLVTEGVTVEGPLVNNLNLPQLR
ncbi:hypothetical protein RB628_26600 [Streptomyces sp. ADMS]|uniref:hypothetical protein n=1 Tax=Streptomyces sp. ADMS TaxID=3071415 RepID=UPI00296E5A48|nr:hypothetical protein [Streptomyces sp. ADMS]MDW4908813.1 hypothetical protein [Streptomyces sp. ADMS]